MTKTDEATVLLVDDEPGIVELYAAWLEHEYDVLTATSGAEALERLDDGVDVVLLDRNMPEVSGDEVLAEIRERELSCRVAMVTAIEPSFDVIDMGFDDYLTKPIFRKDLNETVENLLSLSDYDRTVQEYFSLVSKMATIQSSLPTEELESNDEYAQLQSRLQSIRRSARREFEEIADAGDFESTFKRLSRHWDVYSAATTLSEGAPD